MLGEALDAELLMQEAVGTYGLCSQLIKLSEECGELVRAISRQILHDTQDTKLNLIEEIADVEIVMYQIKHAMNIHLEVDAVRVAKLHRLRDRLRKE